MVYFPTSLAEFLAVDFIEASPVLLGQIASVLVSFAGLFISLSRLIDPQFMGALRKRFHIGS